MPGGKLTRDQLKALVATLRDIVAVLAHADPADKASLYEELGITLTYRPDGTVNVQALPRGVNVRVGGDLNPEYTATGAFRGELRVLIT